jgi:hypothetical protein
MHLIMVIMGGKLLVWGRMTPSLCSSLVTACLLFVAGQSAERLPQTVTSKTLRPES